MTIHLLHVQNMPIFEQLQLEEALMRCDNRNFCLINEGSPPAIVLGISGKADELVDLRKAAQSNIPLIRRFSGGGTVIVDSSTLFITFICERKLHSFPLFPEPILKWTEGLYKEVFTETPLQLRENDYVLGEKKCGGNAQYLKRDRFLHHTSFLWDYCPERMGHLLHPKKSPQYRAGRSHEEFLCRLKEVFPSREQFLSRFKDVLRKHYNIQEMAYEKAAAIRGNPHRKATTIL